MRGGRNLGNAAFFPKVPIECSEADVLSAFIPQYYLGKEVPPRIDTGVVVVTAENIDSPTVQELLDPPLDLYLPSGE